MNFLSESSDETAAHTSKNSAPDIRHEGIAMIILALSSGAVAFEPGAVCAGVNYSQPARTLLQGKHLVLKDSVWSPSSLKVLARALDGTGWTSI